MVNVVIFSQKLIENCHIRNGEELLLIGIEDESSLYLLAATAASELHYAAFMMPGGLKVCGIAASNTDESYLQKHIDMLRKHGEEITVVVKKTSSQSKLIVDSVSELSSDDTRTEVKWKVESVGLSEFVLARTKCHIPLSFLHTSNGRWEHALHTEVESICAEIASDSTMFHLKDTQVLLSNSGCHGLPDNSTVHSLVDMAAGEGEDLRTRKKKDKKQRYLLFDVYTDQSSSCALQKVPSCAPVLNYNTGGVKVVNMMLRLDAVSIFPAKCPMTEMASRMCEALRRQVLAGGSCVHKYSKDEKFANPEVKHSQPVLLDTLLTVLYPEGHTDDQLEKERQQIHRCLCLPLDRPLFRKSNRFSFPDEHSSAGGYLVNVHESVPKSRVQGGTQYCVQGSYTYHHYMQDRFDDNKWGCAYRSLQTLVSWFRLQGYTDVEIPNHNKIQQTLVDIGDKEPSFVGSRKWIGSMEVSFVLDTLLGVTSKILSVSSGAELTSKGRELAAHFEVQGTPIMIGGGVLAHTILGIDYNETSGDINFLILDPHYTGAEDLKIITDKGWCGWKGPEFWDQNAHYNMCMPQRPNVI